MIDDSIVDEVHRLREEIPAAYNGDLHAPIQDMRRQTGDLARAGHAIVARKPRPAEPSPARKIGCGWREHQ